MTGSIYNQMSFQQFISIIRYRWRVILSVLIICGAAALAATLALPTRYAAEAAVLVDISPDPVSATAATGGPEFMQTQQDIASSERVAQRVVKSLPPEEIAQFRQPWEEGAAHRGDFSVWLAGILRRHISVPSTAESNVLTISARWSNAKFAATLANAFAQAYIDTMTELKMEPAKRYAKLFDESSRGLRAELEARQKLLSDYENSHNLIVSDQRLDIENARLTELSSQLVAIQGQRQESQSRQRQVSGGDDSRPEVLQNPLIVALKADLSHAEAKQQDLATRFGTNHPDYLRNEAEIDSLKERIARENARVVDSLSAVTQVNRRRESDISAALAAQKERVLELKHQRDQGAALQNDVLTAQRNLDAVTQHLAQSNLQTQTPQANIVLLTPATEPLAPYSPNFLMNGVIGIVLGLVFGVAAALLLERGDRRIRGDAELIQLLGLPLLAKINSIPHGSRRRRRLKSGNRSSKPPEQLRAP
jgi:chain length determinant protein EpsF